MNIQKSPQVSSQPISQQELFDLLDHLPSMVSIVNKDLIYEFCNRTFIKNNQRQFEEIVGKSIKEICPDAFSTLKKHIKIVLSGKETTFQEELITNNKKIITDGKFTPRYDKEGHVNGYFSYMKNITNEKRLENRLLESKERLNLIQSLSKVGGWHYDFKSQEVWWSKGTYSIFKVNVNEKITFNKFLSYLPENDQQKLLDNWSKSIQDRTDFSKEAILELHKKGGEGNPSIDFMMNRWNYLVETVSITQVIGDYDTMEMIYHDLINKETKQETVFL